MEELDCNQCKAPEAVQGEGTGRPLAFPSHRQFRALKVKN